MAPSPKAQSAALVDHAPKYWGAVKGAFTDTSLALVHRHLIHSASTAEARTVPTAPGQDYWYSGHAERII
eukprot:2740582-Prymnesium_polylepis.1